MKESLTREGKDVNGWMMLQKRERSWRALSTKNPLELFDLSPDRGRVTSEAEGKPAFLLPLRYYHDLYRFISYLK